MTTSPTFPYCCASDEGLQRHLKWAYDGYGNHRRRPCSAIEARACTTGVVTLDLGPPPRSRRHEEGSSRTKMVRLKPDTQVIVASGNARARGTKADRQRSL